MPRTMPRPLVVALALFALLAVLLGTLAGRPASAAPVVSSTAGTAVCATAGATPSCVSDGTGSYYVTHGLGSRPVSVQVTLAYPYAGFATYELGNPAGPSTLIRVRVKRPYDAHWYVGPVTFSWRADAA